ncbi:alpha/beta hydrolase [Cellulomonas sp. DKR-3]|uniref:Alpha/beta hydrolase n=1 Tax=Cellulomonas fulva TaxID=2835530 RepID=A0ABS5TXA8_9CELL|nr:alpha/beta hydrolase [Cellulomonas fulva]MBT0993782.1 alpha/beta hydrolase [Cellulomonas fulva]
MDFTSEHLHDDGVLERELVVGDIPGTLWTPPSGPAPLVLIAHNNGLPKSDPRLVARARFHAARYGYAVATIDATGCGDRPRTPEQERDRAAFRRAMQAGEGTDTVLEDFVGPLVEGAAPDWQTALDALVALPDVQGPVGFSGWAALGIRLATAEPRIAAMGLGAGGYVPRAQREAAPHVTVPLLLMVQWDDEGNPRQRALDLFDAFGSTRKTLHANLGGHLGTPAFELEDGCRFFDRHLR